MRRPADTFRFPPELGHRLRDLRLRAGLTQSELAQAMGRTGKGRECIVSRMEKGSVRFPSLSLVADFLRGCRAGFNDILDILDLYTTLPTTQQQVYGKALVLVASSVPEKWRPQVIEYDLRIDHPKSPEAEASSGPKPGRMERLERARKNAVAARRRMLQGLFLEGVVGKAGPGLSETDKTALFNHGLEWFRVLYQTRRKRPETRERQLAVSEARFTERCRLPVPVIRYVQDAVKEHFGELEQRGELDWLPDLSLNEYELGLLKPASKREQREEQRREFARKADEYWTARKAAVEQVWQEVQPALDEAGVPKERRVVYRGLVGASCNAALDFEPGSVGEKVQLDEYILNPEWIGRGLDTALAQKLAGIMLARFRELAKSLPPDPRPRR